MQFFFSSLEQGYFTNFDTCGKDLTKNLKGLVKFKKIEIWIQ
jgi:hypothetical protein